MTLARQQTRDAHGVDSSEETLLDHTPLDVRQGIHQVATLQTQQAQRTTLGPLKGTPVVQHRLVAGKLIRSMDLNDCMLSSSASAPEPPQAFAREMKSLNDFNFALTTSEGAITTLPRELNPAEKERVALRQEESLLQMKLLQMTQKINRKYLKELVPRDAVDYEQHKLQIAGRFSTQTDLDYYPRKLSPRQAAAGKHRQRTMHAKYGNVLAKSKCSLRGAF